MIRGDPGIEDIYKWTEDGQNTPMRGKTGTGDGVHILTGPIYVCGAEPGDVLQVGGCMGGWVDGRAGRAGAVGLLRCPCKPALAPCCQARLPPHARMPTCLPCLPSGGHPGPGAPQESLHRQDLRQQRRGLVVSGHMGLRRQAASA